ncbi:MAG: hypothetical protein L6V93_11865 [Clostridiales bacterium]|nr:MAG: hypothetical protein L6V93_11865 [Clostridiales bacterium]
MTVSSEKRRARHARMYKKTLRKSGLKSSLGVSNVSFGLPKRPIINASFFSQWQCKNGLDAAIINPPLRRYDERIFLRSVRSRLWTIILKNTFRTRQKRQKTARPKKTAQNSEITLKNRGFERS